MLQTDTAKATNNSVEQVMFLIIEDNDDVWMIVRLMLNRQLPNVAFHRVVNAQQALDYLDETIMQTQTAPKLILQNLYLPLLKDGIELIEGIRAKLLAYSAQQTPILVMSSSNNPDDIRRAYQAGASSFYLKPTDISQWDTYFERLRQFWLESVILPIS